MQFDSNLLKLHASSVEIPRIARFAALGADAEAYL